MSSRYYFFNDSLNDHERGALSLCRRYLMISILLITQKGMNFITHIILSFYLSARYRFWDIVTELAHSQCICEIFLSFFHIIIIIQEIASNLIFSCVCHCNRECKRVWEKRRGKIRDEWVKGQWSFFNFDFKKPWIE